MPLSRALINNSSDVISLLNVAGEILYTSASSADVLGYLPQELLGRNTFDLIHPLDRENSRRALGEVLTPPPHCGQMEARFQQKDGEWRWVESTIFNLLDEPAIAAVVLNCRAINARKREVVESRHSDEFPPFQEVEQFVHAVVHDLREPLRSISMFAELLLRRVQLDEQSRQDAMVLVKSATRLLSLVDDLQALALCGSDQELAQTVDLGLTVAAALEDLRCVIAESGARVTVGVLPSITGNQAQMFRVFQNLIVNAIKYRSPLPLEIQVSAHRSGPAWVIEVKDNGIGIAPQYHEKVFTVLKRLHGPEISGSGLGLAICKRIIEGLGGRIWVISQVGSGSTFCFTLPIESRHAMTANETGTRTV